MDISIYLNMLLIWVGVPPVTSSFYEEYPPNIINIPLHVVCGVIESIIYRFNSCRNFFI